MIRMTELSLSDGSIAYGVSIQQCTDQKMEIDCINYDAAHDPAKALERTTPGGQYDGWSPLKRVA